MKRVSVSLFLLLVAVAVYRVQAVDCDGLFCGEAEVPEELGDCYVGACVNDDCDFIPRPMGVDCGHNVPCSSEFGDCDGSGVCVYPSGAAGGCDDNNPFTIDICGGDGVTCSYISYSCPPTINPSGLTDASCLDGTPDGLGGCDYVTAFTCDDGDSSTIDICLAGATCQHVATSTSTTTDDDNDTTTSTTTTTTTTTDDDDTTVSLPFLSPDAVFYLTSVPSSDIDTDDDDDDDDDGSTAALIVAPSIVAAAILLSCVLLCCIFAARQEYWPFNQSEKHRKNFRAVENDDLFEL